MSKSKKEINEKVSKGKVIDDICEQLQLDDYTQLPQITTQLIDAVTGPIWGIMIVWKPEVMNSRKISVVGIPQTSQAAQQTSDMLAAIAREFTQMALQLATQPATGEDVNVKPKDNSGTPESS